LIRAGVNDAASYDPRDFLRAERNGPHKTNDKREHQTTNYCHTEALHGVVSGNFFLVGCADSARADITGL
jgi:hypothetical protein